MQKLFPPADPPPAPSAPQPSEAEPSEAAAPVRPFAWPPPEEDLDDWHVFQFNETPAPAPPAPAAPGLSTPVTPPTVRLKPSEAPTLKLVTQDGKPALPAEPVRQVEAPLAHLLDDGRDPTLADTAE